MIFPIVSKITPCMCHCILTKKKKEDDIINNPKSVSSYKCKNCGGKRTKIKEEQILRADEPATVIITCLDCGYVEKQT